MTEIELHLPNRSGWDCAADGEVWPCRAYKTYLAVVCDWDGMAMSKVMGWWMASARPTLVLSALQLHDRFAGWIPGWLAKEISD